MTQVHILAIDLAKRSFQVCGTDRGGAVLFNRLLSRARLQQLLNEQSPCIVAMEACAVIPPFLTELHRRIHAAIFSFCAGVMPPMPMLGRSLL